MSIHTSLVSINLYPVATTGGQFIHRYELCSGEWFNGKTAALKVADLGSNPCSPANMVTS